MALNGGLDAARHALVASLDRLPETCRFQVVLYNRSAEPLCIAGKTGLIDATVANKREAAILLKAVVAEGGTDHLRALKKALSLEADTVFFLTDADDLTEDLVGNVTRANRMQNRAGSVIHTIELNTRNRDRDDKPLHILAQRNQGTYQAVRLDADR
jgi:hypothetical protein